MNKSQRREVWSDVYDIEIETDASYRIVGPVSRSKVTDESAFLRVDDISDGKVALVAGSDDPEAGFHTRLNPEQAKKLARSLANAAEYASEQVKKEE